ncbi:MAG: molybdopterin-guanine dinucleotide biosynthesis protein B [Candidatus Brocadia sp.]|jgi:molybdopterin-guanine dinucleotide biosynthesis protein B|nr:Molybdopterin-guanine dinucleotide biosynthesis adapter protein [Candidatus Brocadia fulgida]MCC6325325.1 molybdopterin-guanine dinucleotide biosynthesis protein B [Candidatus Brocadia sp.]MCE7912260.1 molybdopterin-guanine dinucleotide biosynthesis protein B [Candidatus Brocadia sp. AMX3]OQY98122.1 MAG: molybdopterin-guanine dinucleotide biosynthesis protein B [Candidatus Brocadia sp. UTAMX2]RIJ96370.1 MAG: molybdopterin-guanine dinucleotide biosynthesis protein B [Candidatus Brocadia sp.]
MISFIIGVVQPKVPVISIVGKSHSGKTTLVVKLVQELKSRGYRVATIKHSHHSFEIDREGKDSWLHTRAGADAVVVSSQTMTGVMRITPRELPLSEIVNTYLTDVDIVLAEGYKTLTLPKIEVLRSEISNTLICRDDQNLIAVVSDKAPEIRVPFFPIDDTVSALADFILERLKEPRSTRETH